jgi:ABC-type sugar transport system ATPase subunit
MITIDELEVQAGTFRLKGVSLHVPTGEYAVLMGKTGCGKSTLLETICGLKPIRNGRIVLLDRDVTTLPPRERGVGYVPQDLALFLTLTVRDHLGFALEVRGWSQTAIRERITSLAELLGISHLLDRYTLGLSGGESQRVALGRALSFHPRILLLDEPLSALDEDTRGEMVALLRSVQRLTGVTILHVTHSLTEARRLADRLFVFEGPHIREASTHAPGEPAIEEAVS